MKKILVVDDEMNVAEFLKEFLIDTGKFIVQIESSGGGAYKAALSFLPDLILLDIMMKDMSGDALAEQIRADMTLKDTPIVFLTGIVTQNEVNSHNGKIGGYPYLAKPIMDMRMLLDCIDTHARKNGG